MFLTTCTLLPPTFIRSHTRNHSLTRLGLYILTDTQHQIILLFTSPTRLRTDTHTHRRSRGRSRAAPTHTRARGARAAKSSESALPGSLTWAIGSRLLGLGLLGLGLLGLGFLGLGLLGLGLIRLGLARVRSGTGLGLGLGLWLGLVMLIALTTLLTRARVMVRGLLGLGLGLSRLGLRPLQSQALPVQLQHAQRLRFGPLKALGVGLESVRVAGGLFWEFLVLYIPLYWDLYRD